MFHRCLKPLESNSFFIFGARGTGKTTFLKTFLGHKKCLNFDFLNPELEEEYSKHPSLLKEQILAQKEAIDWVVLDEIQRVPKLLNIVHQLIESHKIKFAITGSSARKLKRGQANLLAGRAFWNEIFPLTAKELGQSFDLDTYLNFGGLPKIWNLQTDIERVAYLKSYTTTYVQEEIKSEQLVRNLDPFRKFLEVAAQSSGMIINYSNIHRDVGVDIKTVQSYFSILEDTMMGYFLEPYNSSIRKVLKKSPKFYFFDSGVQRALAQELSMKAVSSTSYYGRQFETFFINQCQRLNKYLEKDFQFYYFCTKDESEIDLVIKRPRKKTLLIEIKSSKIVKADKIAKFARLSNDFSNAESYCASQQSFRSKIEGVSIYPWQDLLEMIFS